MTVSSILLMSICSSRAASEVQRITWGEVLWAHSDCLQETLVVVEGTTLTHH